MLGEAQLRRILQNYGSYYTTERPHQGLQQRIPDRAEDSLPQPQAGGRVHTVPVLGSLHHAY